MAHAENQILDQRSTSAGGPHVGRRRLLTSLTMLVTTAILPQSVAQAETAASAPEIGSIWWNELHTPDPERAHAFYSQVVGWTPKVVALRDPRRSPTEGEKAYTVFTIDGHEAAGAMKMEGTGMEGAPAGWLTYIQVANVDAAAFRAVELGGKLLEQPSDIPNVGRIAIIQDPDGARVGLVAPVGGAR